MRPGRTYPQGQGGEAPRWDLSRHRWMHGARRWALEGGGPCRGRQCSSRTGFWGPPRITMVGIKMELAEQPMRREMVVNLEWDPREHIIEANVLTKVDDGGVDPRRKSEVKPEVIGGPFSQAS